MMNRMVVIIALTSLVVILPHSAPAFAQAARTSESDAGNLRFFQQFVNDAAIVDRWWFSGELRIERGAVTPISSIGKQVEDADGFLLTPVVAVSPIKNLEVGGQVSYIDYDLDRDIVLSGGTRFDGESGL